MEAQTGKQVVGYVRVSVDNETKVSPEMQTEQIEKFCELKGWELVHIEVERGRSAGEGKKRPGLDKVRRMIRKGAASGFVVWKIDRCSRSVRDFSEILAELQKHKADFVSVTESFDTSNAMGVAMLQITMVFAQLERSRSSERITAWHNYRASAGRQPGGPIPFGYVKDDDGHLQLDEETAPLVKQAAATFVETHSVGQVQRFLQQHGHLRHQTVIAGLLQGSVIAGVRYVDGVKVRGDWPAIIDEATHDAIVAEFAKPERRRKGRPSNERWLLSSIAFCGRPGCGAAMGCGPLGAGSGGRYKCASYRNNHKSDVRCALTINRTTMDTHVEKRLLAWVTPEMWAAIRVGRQQQDAPPVMDTAAMEADLAALAEDWGAGRITRGEWDAARAALMARITDAEAQTQDWDTPELDLPDVDNLHKAWPDMGTGEKRLVLSAFIDRVVVAPGEIGANGTSDPTWRVQIFWR